MGQGMGARWLPSLRLYFYTVSHPRRFRRPAALYAPQAVYSRIPVTILSATGWLLALPYGISVTPPGRDLIGLGASPRKR
jgi:hypothetical protein